MPPCPHCMLQQAQRVQRLASAPATGLLLLAGALIICAQVTHLPWLETAGWVALGLDALLAAYLGVLAVVMLVRLRQLRRAGEFRWARLARRMDSDMLEVKLASGEHRNGTRR